MRLLGLAALAAIAQTHAATPCQKCAEWNTPQQPFRIYGDTYYVGVHGLSSILITSPEGDVLIDGGLPESASQIAANVRALGFRLEDIKLILNSHVHFDHAGGLAELQRLTGAKVAVSEPTARVLKTGQPAPDDPQFGELPAIQPVKKVKIVKDGEMLRVGSLELTAYLTPGHTRGGTTWTWRSCENPHCVNIVYADSLSAVAADAFRFTTNSTYPKIVQDFRKSFVTINALPCDILLTPHPEASDLWERLAQRDKSGDDNAFVDPTACQQYTANARKFLEQKLAKETGQSLTNQ